MSITAAGTNRQSMAALLQFAWDADVFTANDAIPVVGLTRSTTIDALDRLIELGLVAEEPNAREVGDYRRGRPARRFRFRTDAAVVVGVDAGHAHLGVEVADLAGATLARHAVELNPAIRETGYRREQTAAAVDVTLGRAGRARADVVTVCLGVPAPVDSAGRSPHHAQGFWELMNPGMRDLFSEWAPIVRVENDAALAAVAERRVGVAVGCDDFVALLAGRRFGAGVVVGGQLLRGANGGVGEMTPLNQLAGVMSPDGLGDWLTGSARRAIGSGEIPAGHPLSLLDPEGLSGRDVLAHADDPLLAGVFERVAAAIARIIGLLGSMYDPEVVVLCGAIAAGIGPVLPRAQELLAAEMDLPAPRLVASALGGEVVVAGAVAAAIESAQEQILDLVTSGAFAVRGPSIVS